MRILPNPLMVTTWFQDTYDETISVSPEGKTKAADTRPFTLVIKTDLRVDAIERQISEMQKTLRMIVNNFDLINKEEDDIWMKNIIRDKNITSPKLIKLIKANKDIFKNVENMSFDPIEKYEDRYVINNDSVIAEITENKDRC